jgi:tetratricopeptide (TPR) repeat protein
MKAEWSEQGEGAMAFGSRPESVISSVMVAAIFGMVFYANFRDAGRPEERFTIKPLLGSPGGQKTTREGLAARVAEMESRLAERPEDSGAAILLADALMRQARVLGNGGLVIRAEEALRAALEEDPGDYDARRMLATVLLSQHRFREAIVAATVARDMRPADAWNYGVIGDGHLELGEYDQAFNAFQQMMDLRPSAAAYARAAYAAELQGQLDRALETMEMAADATTPHDPESQAWHEAQLGDLNYQMGRLDEARRHFDRANALFPDHPFAVIGIATVTAARGDYRTARRMYQAQLERTPTMELAAAVGDLAATLGEPDDAERYYRLAEDIARETVMRDGSVAGFLAERDRRIDEALKLAQEAAAWRQDIFTEDALAWVSFKAGRLAEADAASRRALRTGTRDRRILYHAAAIRTARGDLDGAQALVERSLAGNRNFDPLVAPAATDLYERLTSGQTLARR